MFGKRKDKEKSEDKSTTNDEEVREQLHRLQEQMDALREKVGITEEERRSRRRHRDPFDPEFTEEMKELGREMGVRGKELGHYISMVVGDVMRGVDKTLRKSIFVGPHGRTIRFHNGEIFLGDEDEAIDRVPPEEAQKLLSPLASAERINILYILSDGAQYHQDLMNASGLAPGTLPHHLKQLEEAGYITQERVRGRYLITIPGRMALKLAEYLYNQMQMPKEESKAKTEDTGEA